MSAKILVIDDDGATMAIIASTLNGAGYSVVPAYGGADAIRKAKRQQPALVLTDLEMPRFNGVEIIDALRKDAETQHIPIVAVTAHMWDGIAQSAGQVGCDGYLAKPFLPKQLLETVRKYLVPATPKSG